MKIAFYSPYLNISGGGERYLLSIAEYLCRNNDVYIFGNKTLSEKIKEYFGIDLSRVKFLDENMIRYGNIIEKYRSLGGFDAFFYMTDGSLFFSASRKNFLIIQSPSHIPSSNVINRLKISNWQIICYSDFMKKIIHKQLGIAANILSPVINTAGFKSDFSGKKSVIISVGRFFPHPHSKKHDFLIDFFIKNFKSTFKDWKLIIAGGLTEEGGKEILEKLNKKTPGFPVEIKTNITFKELVSLYVQAKIYWHAAGFGEDIGRFPERAEHFGITTLEAMAAGCVPLVYEAGGQKDIVNDGINGYLWQTEDNFLNENHKLLKDEKLMIMMSNAAVRRSADFSPVHFYENLDKIISK